MTLAIAVLSIVAFAIAFTCCRIPGVARGAVSTALAALAVIRDPTLDDATREQMVRRASLKMFRDFASIVMRAVVVLAMASLPILLATELGVASTGPVVELLSRWDVMLGAALALTVGWVLKERVWRRK